MAAKAPPQEVVDPAAPRPVRRTDDKEEFEERRSGMILVFGSINMDLVARVGTIARPGETVLSRRADSFFGGKGANQAVAAARASRGGLMEVAMAGAVGDDPFGHACLANLRENGVDAGGIRI